MAGTRSPRRPSALRSVEGGDPKQVGDAAKKVAKAAKVAAKRPAVADGPPAGSPARGRKQNDDLLYALAIGDKLGEFEGLPVLRSAIVIPALGGGLREAVNVLALAFKKGTDVYILTKGHIEDIDHKAIKDVDGWTRVHKVVPDEVTFVDPEFGERQMAEARTTIRKIRDELVGQGTFDVDGDE